MLYKITKPRAFCLLPVIGLMLTATPATSAQEKPAGVTLELKDLKIENKGVEDSDGNHTLALYDTIKIKVEKLEEWVGKPKHDYLKFILYIDGNALKGITPALVENSTKLQFDLKHIPDSEETYDAWTAVLSRRPMHWTRDVPVTVGIENEGQVESFDKVPLTVIDQKWFWVFVISSAAAIVLFGWLAYKSDVIRSPGPQPKGTNKRGKPNRKPYSLARTQMAFWFFIVVISYVFIWMVTSDLSNLTPSVLGLIGISAATGLGATVVDSSKRGDQENLRQALEETKTSDEVKAEKLKSETSTLNTAIKATPAPANLEEQKTALAAKMAELAAKEKEIAQTDEKLQKLADKSTPAVSKNFINDILSDDDGVSFHRFQIFAWTIVLIIIFIGKIYNDLAMPDFDATLLGLMGISGGTYVGFKLPTQQG